MFEVMRYSEWSDTAHALHMLLQMMGKTKLARMTAQPEWNEALLYLAVNGFTTGLIPGENGSFAVTLDLSAHEMRVQCTNGNEAGFPLWEEASVSRYYAAYCRMLEDVGLGTALNPKPQETSLNVPFDEQTKVNAFVAESAWNYFQSCVFAHNVLLDFAAPFRGKKILPSLFWGTFDMTTVLFSGAEEPFAGGGLIERVAFDERFVEFGFWPGDPQTDDPSFFVLPYPFREDLQDKAIRPDEAFFSPQKKEFFLRLQDAAKYEDPAATVRAFCEDAFAIAAEAGKWQALAWLTKPLPH